MAKLVDIPTTAAIWQPIIPTQEDLQSVIGKVGGVGWARQGAEAAFTWAQAAQAELINTAQTQLDALIPDELADGTEQLFKIGWSFGQANTERELLEAAAGAADTLAQILDNSGAIAKVPIVGWIVGALTALANVGITIWEHKKAEQESAIEKVGRMQYDALSDENSSREVLQMIAKLDWTWLFMPFSVGPIESYKLIDPIPDGPNRTWILGGDRIGFGATPGFGRVYRAWEFDTTIPLKVMRTRGVGHAGGWSGYRPVTTVTATQAWSRVETPTAQAFRVDMLALQTAWDQWDAQLLPLAYGDDQPEDSQIRARNVVSPTLMLPKIPEKFRSYVGAGKSKKRTVGALVRMMTARQRRRQFALLDTIQCAYVPERSAAFDDPDLFERLKERRERLLTHPAVHAVEKNAIPAADTVGGGGVTYRQALAEAQGNVAFPLQAKLPPQFMVDDPAPIPPVTIPRGFGPQRQGRGGALLLLILAGLAAG